MNRRGRTLGRRQRACRSGRRGQALSGWVALPLAVIAVIAVLGQPGYAAASGSGTLTFTPPNGPAGTQVTVTIAADPPGPTAYLLSASPADPASNSCADGVTPDDAPKIIVMPGQPTTTTFTWPAQFFSGAYYLCASPAGGLKGPTVWSQQPFRVGSGTPTEAVPTPTHSAVVAQVTSDGVTAGGVVTLTVDTVTLGGATPQYFTLIRPGQPGAVQVNWVEAGQHLSVYTYDISIPNDTPPGTYAVRVIAGDSAVTSNAFQVVSVPARGGGPGPNLSPPALSVPGASAISPVDTLLVAAIVLLLALAVASLATPLLRRWRQGARSR